MERMGNEILCQPSKMVDNMLVYRRNVETPTPQEVRVAAYCRVSKNLFSQESSIELQMDSYRKRISEHPGWYLVGIYADRGSGTTVSGRMEFQKLIQDALDGKIDYILAKSVSRFARNTLDTLSYTRKLKDIGVGVYFEEQSLDTMGMFSEIFLTIHAAFAQEESHSLSENMKHGMRNRFALGIPKWSETYGYRRNEDEIWYVHKEEAKVVREIYRLYTEGYSISEIKTELDERRIQPPKGSRTISGDSVWWTHSIATILHSEKYIGDLEMQKSYTVDYMTRKRVQNTNADIPKYYRKSHHERIIDDETFMITQTILMMQSRHRSGGSQYPFYGFLQCPLCGENMVRLRLPTRKHETAWFCRDKCEPYVVKDKYLQDSVTRAYERLYGTALSRGIHYKLLLDYVDSITFVNKNNTVDWSTLQITWKNGKITEEVIRYEVPSDIPCITLEKQDEWVVINGEKVTKHRNVYECIERIRAFVRATEVIDGGAVPLVTTPDSKKIRDTRT